MALYLGPADLESLFSRGLVGPSDCVQAVHASFREHGMQSVSVLPRRILWADEREQGSRARALKLSAAYMQGSGVMGASVYAVHYQPGSVDMWLTVFSGSTGRMLGIIHGKSLSIWKTAATGAVAAQQLARHDASRVALIGTGGYAMAQLQFLQAVLPLRSVVCHSRNGDALRAFCTRARELLQLPVVACGSVCEAVADADVVVTITTSTQPVLSGAWLPAGVHSNVMGQHAPAAREVDTQAVVESYVVVDAFAQALQEKGELLIPLQEEAVGRGHFAAELGGVIVGHSAGRVDPTQKTMFCSGGTAFEYMGLCAMLIERAEAAGVGQVLSS